MEKNSNVIKFPTDRVVHNNKPVKPKLSEEETRQIKEDIFVDQITESLILDIIHVLQENVVDTKTDVFLRDLAIVIEATKGLLKRDFGRDYPMVEKLLILIMVTLLLERQKNLKNNKKKDNKN